MDPHGLRQEPLEGDKGILSREAGQVASYRPEPGGNMGTLGYIRKPLVKGQKRGTKIQKHLSG